MEENAIIEICSSDYFSYLSKDGFRPYIFSDNDNLYFCSLFYIPGRSYKFGSLQLLVYNISTNLWGRCNFDKNILHLRILHIKKIDENNLWLCGSTEATSTTEICLKMFTYKFREEKLHELMTQSIGGISKWSFFKTDYDCSSCRSDDDNVYLSIWSSTGFLSILKLNNDSLWKELYQNSSTLFLGNQMVGFDKKLIFFGGRSSETKRAVYRSFKDIPFYDLCNDTWGCLEANVDAQFGFPDARYYHSTILYKDYAILSAGKNAEQVFDDIWLFHIPTLKWTKLPFKLPVKLHSHASAVNNNAVIICAGFTDIENWSPNRGMFKLNVDIATQCINLSSNVPRPLSAEDSLEKLECDVCFKRHFILKYLSCGTTEKKHAFCQECLQKLLSKASTSEISCPKCRTQTHVPPGGVKQLPSKLLLQLRCEVCEELKNVDDQWWCKECETSVCSACVIKQHRAHTLEHWENYVVFKDCKSMFQKHVKGKAAVKEKIEEYHQQIDKLKVKLHKIELAESFVESIENTFGTLEEISEPVNEQKSEKKLKVALEIMKKCNKCCEVDVEMLINAKNEIFD